MTLLEISRLVNRQLPAALNFDRAYRSLEGDYRVIAKDWGGREYRFTVVPTLDGAFILEPMA